MMTGRLVSRARAGIGVSGLALLALVAASAGDDAKPPSQGKAAPPPLVIEDDAPTLADAPANAPADLAANVACYVCHGNYRPEPLAATHARHEVACAACHGDSFAHRNDENHLTPPDIMIAVGKIDASCRSCHDQHDAPAQAVVARFLARRDHLADPTARRVVCTDCHGAHRLDKRMVRWDRDTRKLLPAPETTGGVGGSAGR
jgi:hypothetical protein